MKSIKLYIAILFSCLAAFTGCNDFQRELKGDTTPVTNNIVPPLFSDIGSAIELPGLPTPVTATVIDLDGDGMSDGLDIDGDGTPEILFLTDSAITRVGIDLDGDGETDYFLAADESGALIIAPDLSNAGSETLYIISDGMGNILGIDLDGDGTSDDNRLGSIFTDEEPPTLTTNAHSGTYSHPVEVDFDCTDNYACHHISYTLESPNGETTGIVWNSNGMLNVGTSGDGAYVLTYMALDFAGNPSETLVLAVNITNPSFRITKSGNQTGEDGSTVELTISLAVIPDSVVNLPISVSKPGEASSSAASVGLDAGMMSQTVTITGLDDDIDDGNKSYKVTVGPASSGDADYDGLNSQSVSFINVDDDTAGVVVDPDSDLVTSESGTTDSFSVALTSEPEGTVVINVATQSGTTDQVTVSPSSLTFNSGNWDTGQTVTVTGQDDIAVPDITSDTDTIVLSVNAGSTTDNKYSGLSGLPSLDVTNVDNDTASIIINPLTSTTLDDGETHTFAVYLASDPGSTSIDFQPISFPGLIVGVDTVPGGGLPATFTSGDYTTPQIFSITVSDSDDLAEGSQGYAFTIEATGGIYAGLTKTINLTVNDDDQAGLTISGALPVTTDEDGTTSVINVALTSEPATSPVTVLVDVSDTDEGQINAGSTLTFTSGDWFTTQPVVIGGVDDFERDGTKAYTVTLTASGSSEYDALPVRNLNATNLDDDRYLFLSASTSNGNLGGIGGADDLCKTDPNRPPDNALTFKAMIVDGVNRTAVDEGLGVIDWVMEGDTHYFRTDGSTHIFTTDSAAIFSFGTFTNTVSATPGLAWTGLNDDWTSSGSNCNEWSASSMHFGQQGSANKKTEMAIESSAPSCAVNARLYCVEQP